MFRHPKYYKELKEFGKRGDRGKPTAASPDTDQAISYDDSTESQGVRPGPGQQASSSKQQAIEEIVPHNDIEEAASVKHQAIQDS